MEELQMIVNAVKEMATLGSQVGVWWIVIHYAVKLIGMFLVAGTIFAVAKLGFGTIQSYSIAVKLRDMLGIGSPGCMTRDEERELYRMIVELAQKGRP